MYLCTVLECTYLPFILTTLNNDGITCGEKENNRRNDTPTDHATEI
jgi:hypothetical protein